MGIRFAAFSLLSTFLLGFGDNLVSALPEGWCGPPTEKNETPALSPTAALPGQTS